MELPVEVEIELAPAASLKQAPLWKELVQLLENPYAPIERRPGFGVSMPDLNLWPLDYNFLTGQPLRLRTNDGEVSWDQPGPLFDPDEDVEVDAFNVPTDLRTPIGALVASDDEILDPGEVDGSTPCTTCGFMLVSNPGGDERIPPDGTLVAVPAVVEGILHEYDAATGELEPLTELEIPINEEDFFREDLDSTGIPAELLGLPTGREAAEALGKALFWDMQVGSDGVQACGSCHFSAGADTRTQNSLNPNHLGGDFSLQVAAPNQEVVASDFPFHKLVDPSIPGEPLLNPNNVASDANDVVSSMGVAFQRFVDIPAIGSFGPAVNGVAPLLPDIGSDEIDPIAAAFVDPDTGENLRRVEPRNTPTMHSAAFNFDNFWDGRARFHFNGGSVFGQSDPQVHVFVDPGLPGDDDLLVAGDELQGATNGYYRPDLLVEDSEVAEQPVRIKFSSLASQALGPPLSDFEMSFAGRNWAKIAKKMLQSGVTPLANQLVDTTDSVMGLYSNQGGDACVALGRATAADMPGLCVSYLELVQLAYPAETWQNLDQHFDGAADASDPFDGYSLVMAPGAADPADTNQFTHMEANFSLFFGLGVQAYIQLLIPDDTPFDKFMDANPLAANAVGEPGSLNVLHPALVPDLVGGSLTLIPDDPSTPEYDGFGEEELVGFDIFGGANLTAALPLGSNMNPAGMGSNPFARSARCMLCHLGPEQTDHSISISHGLLKGDAEYEFPTPPEVPDPNNPGSFLPAPEPTGPLAVVQGLILEEEIAGSAQDAVEVEPRSFAMFDDPATAWDDRIISQPNHFAFGDQGIYNIGLRPTAEDISRGGTDAFGWPLSLSALALINITGDGAGNLLTNPGDAFDPPDDPSDSAALMDNFDPLDPSTVYEESGESLPFPGTTLTLQSINPGFEKDPITPLLPEYMAPWANGLPAGELHPQIDEMAFAPNTITAPNGGPAVEFTEYIFGDDVHCSTYDPGTFGAGAPNYGWGATDPVSGALVDICPNNQSGVASNIDYPLHGTWPMANRVLRNGTFKAPQLRNIELTGPYFHTGSYLTLRQVVDFYMRGGDFPITNAEDRDPHIVDIGRQLFSFGRSNSVDGDLDLFADALPDPDFRYDAMPDTDHPSIPEPVYMTPEFAKVSLVKFLLALTDQRVKYERAPFDRPEIFVPLDGRAGSNTGGRDALLADPMFIHIEAVGFAGHPDPLQNFLGISSTPVDGPDNDHFDRSFVPLPPDTTPPNTTITSGPEPASTLTSVEFAFSSNEDGQSFECSLDGGPFIECISPVAYTGLSVGTHTFEVRAIDLAGNVDPTPAVYGEWTVQDVQTLWTLFLAFLTND